ncbi:MAG: hypothetical protein COX80_01965 [Candidatus Magasanikbacteria bacterium CG_4_10_14_0_2_um_filter_33_14]|uniref:Uncharacterized protein n=1 Tax=Candidatus Magasanikbacteria bacterium CG_4_10_14_0_2_um_filter_33_14 TaxID=1974636 RepID=A0A2M7VB37_9BACT|nr:MAG: hypothetical protein COX80_01965 [Candidatus Magasanikbacteria bacterium CG_4_10_14_0_2_um_filter_33_14]
MNYKKYLKILVIVFVFLSITEFFVGFPVYFFQYFFPKKSITYKVCDPFSEQVCDLKVGDYFYLSSIGAKYKSIAIKKILDRQKTGFLSCYYTKLTYDNDYIEDTGKVVRIINDIDNKKQKENNIVLRQENPYFSGFYSHVLYKAKLSGEGQFNFKEICVYGSSENFVLNFSIK